MDETENGQRRLSVAVSKAVGEAVEIAVSDSGKGISGDDIDNIVEAFFTTQCEGMGMGLAIRRSIIESHNGRLWATSEPHLGTTFRFTIPVSMDENSSDGEQTNRLHRG